MKREHLQQLIHVDALKLICEFEGFHRLLPDGRAAPYRCPAGIWTLAFGSIFRRDGSRVGPDDEPVTREEGMELMAIELAQKCLPAVARLITVPLHPLSHGALVSFSYNLGAGALKGSGLRRAINAEAWERVRPEFMKWRMAGGKVLRGLERRRAAEADMFEAGVAAMSGRSAAAAQWEAVLKRAV